MTRTIKKKEESEAARERVDSRRFDKEGGGSMKGEIKKGVNHPIYATRAISLNTKKGKIFDWPRTSGRRKGGDQCQLKRKTTGWGAGR